MKKLVIIFLAVFLVSGCSGFTKRNYSYQPALKATTVPAEEKLLDVGIEVFDPGLETGAGEGVYPGIRKAESQFIPHELAKTIQGTGYWGAVRVVPVAQTEMDVYVAGTIVESNGEEIEVKVSVRDITGKHWYTRSYMDKINQQAYNIASSRGHDPFQNLYNEIANDLIEERRSLTNKEQEKIRVVKKLLFAQRFAPEFYQGYVVKDRDGIYQVQKLPARNDPIMAKIDKIKERDELFIDTIQDYYAGFSNSMMPSYSGWRQDSYREILARREVEQAGIMRVVLGAALLVGGIAAQGSGSAVTRSAGAVGIGGGAILAGKGVQKLGETEIHDAALEELASSLELDVQDHTIKLDQRTIKLTGSVEEQYAKWRQILRKIYLYERGFANL